MLIHLVFLARRVHCISICRRNGTILKFHTEKLRTLNSVLVDWCDCVSHNNFSIVTMHLPPCCVLSACCMCRFIAFFLLFLLLLLVRVHKNLLLLNNHSLTTLHVGQWFAKSTQHADSRVSRNSAPNCSCPCVLVIAIKSPFFFSVGSFSGRRYRYLFAGVCRFHHEERH